MSRNIVKYKILQLDKDHKDLFFMMLNWRM